MITTNFIRIGRSPGVYPGTDRWNGEDGSLHYNTWNWVEESKWKDIQYFQSPIYSLDSLAINGRFPEHTTMNDIIRLFPKTAAEIENRLKLSNYSIVWQMELLSADKTDYVRALTCMGESTLVEWSWFDVNVKLPTHKAYCAWWNKYKRPAIAKEIEKNDEEFRLSRHVK